MVCRDTLVCRGAPLGVSRKNFKNAKKHLFFNYVGKKLLKLYLQNMLEKKFEIS